eukprot:2317181-Alexandrium_andersonii.AAC.1
MSASLVGSEMCIRDRLRQRRRRNLRAGERRRRSGRPFVGRRVQVDAVSYTHLTLPTICSV